MALGKCLSNRLKKDLLVLVLNSSAERWAKPHDFTLVLTIFLLVSVCGFICQFLVISRLLQIIFIMCC